MNRKQMSLVVGVVLFGGAWSGVEGKCVDKAPHGDGGIELSTEKKSADALVDEFKNAETVGPDTFSIDNILDAYAPKTTGPMLDRSRRKLKKLLALPKKFKGLPDRLPQSYHALSNPRIAAALAAILTTGPSERGWTWGDMITMTQGDALNILNDRKRALESSLKEKQAELLAVDHELSGKSRIPAEVLGDLRRKVAVSVRMIEDALADLDMDATFITEVRDADAVLSRKEAFLKDKIIAPLEAMQGSAGKTPAAQPSMLDD